MSKSRVGAEYSVRIEAAKQAARDKREQLGLDPRPEENLEYEAQEAARTARQKRKRS